MSQTLPPGYFEDLYAKAPDPWDFEKSAYEAAKCQDTVATLPRAGYKQGLEIGCRIVEDYPQTGDAVHEAERGDPPQKWADYTSDPRPKSRVQLCSSTR